MKFKSRIMIAFLLMSVIPAVSLLLVSAYMLNNAFKRVGLSELEQNFRIASQLVDQGKDAARRALEGSLNDFPYEYNAGAVNSWQIESGVDLAFVNHDTNWFISGPSVQNLKVISDSAASSKAIMEIEGASYLVATTSRGDTIIGCGVKMPADFTERGHEISRAISSLAGLSIYREFSLRLLFISAIAVIFLAAVAGFLAARTLSARLAEPLEQLSKGAESLGRGDLDHRIEIAGNDEFSFLAGSFNAMASEIKMEQAKLLEAQRLAAWREVARKIAHEIRNPLTPIAVELYRIENMMAQKGIADDGSLRSIRAIRSQTESLTELARHFSIFAKEPELKLRSCSLEEIISNATAIYTDQADISVKYECHPPLLNLDPEMILRAFTNLLKNSIEASGEKAIVSIRVSETENELVVEFRDRGPGFPESKLAHIDTPFSSEKKGGSGLGIVIVSKIISEHGGCASFYNDGGAVVRMTIPLDLSGQ